MSTSMTICCNMERPGIYKYGVHFVDDQKYEEVHRFVGTELMADLNQPHHGFGFNLHTAS